MWTLRFHYLPISKSIKECVKMKCKNCKHELVYYNKEMSSPMVLWNKGWHHKRRLYLVNCNEITKGKYCNCTNPVPINNS